MVEEHKFKKICAEAKYNEDNARSHRVCVCVCVVATAASGLWSSLLIIINSTANGFYSVIVSLLKLPRKATLHWLKKLLPTPDESTILRRAAAALPLNGTHRKLCRANGQDDGKQLNNCGTRQTTPQQICA